MGILDLFICSGLYRECNGYFRLIYMLRLYREGENLNSNNNIHNIRMTSTFQKCGDQGGKGHGSRHLRPNLGIKRT